MLASLSPHCLCGRKARLRPPVHAFLRKSLATLDIGEEFSFSPLLGMLLTSVRHTNHRLKEPDVGVGDFKFLNLKFGGDLKMSLSSRHSPRAESSLPPFLECLGSRFNVSGTGFIRCFNTTLAARGADLLDSFFTTCPCVVEALRVEHSFRFGQRS